MQMGKSACNKIVRIQNKYSHFSFNHERISQLLDFIIKMPPEDCSHDRGHK